jgi:multidrug efflux pump subunit AcrA (membrane-fusion protein)
MKKYTKLLVVCVLVIAGLLFILRSFRNSSMPPETAAPPDIAATPIRLYGIVEPAGREVFVSPPMTKRVIAVDVREGDLVTAGQQLCELENSVERQQVELAAARVALSQKALELNADEVRRTKRLYADRVDSEYRYTQALLSKELEEKRIQVARGELQVARAQLEQTVLRAPVDGMVYKFDVRLGETLGAGENSRIVLGSRDLWVRLHVESFWRDRIRPGMRFTVADSETGREIGSGTVVQRMPYMGRRDFRTEDLQERFDTKFQEVILSLAPGADPVPIGLSVVAHLQAP